MPASGPQLLIPTSAGEEHRVSIPGLTGASIRGFLPDNTGYVVYGHETGKKSRMYVYSPALHQLRSISPEGFDVTANALFVSPDGNQVVLEGSDRALILSLKSGEAGKVRVDTSDQIAGWTADSHALFVLHSGEDHRTAIYKVEVASGNRNLVRELAIPEGYSAYSLRITSDGRRYAFMRISKLSELYTAEGIH